MSITTGSLQPCSSLTNAGKCCMVIEACGVGVWLCTWWSFNCFSWTTSAKLFRRFSPLAQGDCCTVINVFVQLQKMHRPVFETKRRKQKKNEVAECSWHPTVGFLRQWFMWQWDLGICHHSASAEMNVLLTGLRTCLHCQPTFGQFLPWPGLPCCLLWRRCCCCCLGCFWVGPSLSRVAFLPWPG